MTIPAPSPGSAAFITGASSGIGKALARSLAARGHDVVLVARRREQLETLAEELRSEHEIRADVVVADLADDTDRTRLLADVHVLDRPFDVLVLCAGFGMVGPYVDHDAARMTTMVRTNIEATFTLAHALIPPMVARARGAVLFVSSMAGNQPMPNFAPYAATKAAVTSLGEALHSELKPHGITVSVLAPAMVATEFSTVAQAERHASRQPKFLTATADQCAGASLVALDKGKRKVVPLVQARIFARIAQQLPRGIWLPVCRKMLS